MFERSANGKRKQTEAQALAAERNFAKGRSERTHAAMARNEAAKQHAARTPEQKLYDEQYAEARDTYNAEPTLENFQTLNGMRGKRP